MIFNKSSNKKEPKLPKKADNAIHLLEGLIQQLEYFYFGNEKRFKQDVLKDAFVIEKTLKELAINKKETFRRLKSRYDHLYAQKIQTHDHTVLDVNDSKLNDRIKEKYEKTTKHEVNRETNKSKNSRTKAKNRGSNG